MKYETRMQFDKHIITEEYVVDSKTYRAEFAIHPLGVYAGMAGYEACRVGINLYKKGSKFQIGYVYISFPLLKRADVDNPEHMLVPCLEKDICWANPPARRFTPYAEREIERVVTEFIRKEKDFSAMGIPLHTISVIVGPQDSSGRGRPFPRGLIRQGCA